MFPTLRQRIAERLDPIVELATLGEFGLSADLRPVATGADAEAALRPRPRLREGCEVPRSASTCRDGAPTRS